MLDFSEPDILMTPDEIILAKERGRRMAAEAVRCSPDSRKRVESKYGVEFCKARWPEAYTEN
jgi:hypothetical protein